MEGCPGTNMPMSMMYILIGKYKKTLYLIDYLILSNYGILREFVR
jgi:hypothetical protein